MKQKTKIILHSVSHLLLYSGLIFIVGTFQHKSPAPAPSHSIPSTISLAGQPAKTATPSAQPAASKSSTTISTASATSSPKYDQIKQTVQHEYVYHMFAGPNDPRYSSNWPLAKINAPAAWNVATGNGQTVVAVIDTGFALAHEDLTNRWYTNTGETGMTKVGDRCWTGTPQPKQSNNCDDDNNGYVDDWRGWSFVQANNNPQAGRQNTTGAGVSHGTEVAGIVGAETNNSVGVATLDWNTKIMPLQALDDTGTGYTSDITSAIYYAVDNGAQVINLSLGAYSQDPAMQAAVNYATAHNVVIVAAAGNCGDGTSSECTGVPVGTVAYPASYPDVIAVGATTADDQRASFSSFGKSIDVSAPGYGNPASTAWSASNQTSLYSGLLYGTSFASPQVSSLAALIKSIRPGTSVADITALIDATASKPSSMNGLLYTQQLGHGIINAGAALSIAAALNATAPLVPALSQDGSSNAEHTALAGNTVASGCTIGTSNAPCTIEMTSSDGYKRYLPYTLVSSGSTGWSWSADMLETDSWQVRTRSGDNVSTTPYSLLKLS